MMTWVVNGLLYTDFLVVRRLGKASWLYGLFKANFLLKGRLMVVTMVMWVINSLFNADLFLVVWLEASTVLTLDVIKLGLV